MKTWVTYGAILVASVVGVVYLTSPQPAPPAPLTQPEPAPVAANPGPAEQVALAQVVDVTDIDPLLDPPAIPLSEPSPHAGPVLTAVGYDEPAAHAVPSGSPVAPIPPATD